MELLNFNTLAFLFEVFWLVSFSQLGGHLVNASHLI